MNRRKFLGVTASGVGGAALSAPLKSITAPINKKQVLILGGANYVGPHLVQVALEQGHEVTLFNRGFTNPNIFPHLEHLIGNRFDNREAGLSALRGSREWDLVIDTWDSEPGCVFDTARLLADRAERYVYVSSIAVLHSYLEAGLDEASTTVDAAEHLASYDPELGYKERKRAAELAVLEHFGDRATVLRCSSVHGLNYNRSFLPYWGSRFMSGEPVLVPDDRTAMFQWTDVRDIGRFAVYAAENNLGGVFNLINPPEPVPLWDFFLAWHAATGRRSQMVAASRSFLSEHNVQPWSDLPFYIPEDDPEPGFYRIDARRAHATGFSFRPLGETIADVIRTFPNPLSPGFAGETHRKRELELIWKLTGGRTTR